MMTHTVNGVFGIGEMWPHIFSNKITVWAIWPMTVFLLMASVLPHFMQDELPIAGIKAFMQVVSQDSK